MTSFSSIAKRIFGLRPVGGRAAKPEHKKTGLGRDSRGTAAVEFGILLPFIVMLLAGVVELGKSLWQHHTLTKGVRDAGRYLSRLDNSTLLDAGSISATATTLATNIALRGSFTSTAPYRFDHWASSAMITITLPSYPNTDVTYPYPLRGGASILTPLITVVVVPPASEFPLLSLFGATALNYSARHQVRHIGE